MTLEQRIKKHKQIADKLLREYQRERFYVLYLEIALGQENALKEAIHEALAPSDEKSTQEQVWDVQVKWGPKNLEEL